MIGRDELYRQAAEEFGAALGRLTRGYEADPERRRDLLQEVHLALWRSFEGFGGQCSLRTWVYRVAHNTAISWITRQRRSRQEVLVSLEELEIVAPGTDMDRSMALRRLTEQIRRLNTVDRQIILSWLEGMDAGAIGELTGLSPGNVATKIHRIKQVLARDFNRGGLHGN